MGRACSAKQAPEPQGGHTGACAGHEEEGRTRMAFQERNPAGGGSSEEWAGSLCLEVGGIFLLQVWSSMKGGSGIKGNKLPVRREEMDQSEEAAGTRWEETEASRCRARKGLAAPGEGGQERRLRELLCSKKQ